MADSITFHFLNRSCLLFGSMHQPTRELHVIWSEAIAYQEATNYRGPTDFGVYAIYGSHPTHGPDTLLYIGRSLGGSFGWRVPQHDNWLQENQVCDITVHFGRFTGIHTPSNENWNREIELAERLLIFAHKPLFNEKVNLGTLDDALKPIHLLNWRQPRTLLPEVSGLRWTGGGGTPPGTPYRDGDQPTA